MSSYVERRLVSLKKRAYSLSKDALALRDMMSPYEDGLYGETAQHVSDGAITLYFAILDALGGRDL